MYNNTTRARNAIFYAIIILCSLGGRQLLVLTSIRQTSLLLFLYGVAGGVLYNISILLLS